MATPDTLPAAAKPRRPIVLCIDDDPLVLHFYQDFLGACDYDALTTTDGLLGIQLARETRPDVILLDVMLRGLSGFDICRKFRADPALREIPIILVTVWDRDGVANTGRDAGATLTLQKTADTNAILGAIAEVLHREGHPEDQDAPTSGGPSGEKATPPAMPQASQTEVPSPPPTVLCIDDDARVLELFQAMLESRGYRALGVTDGLQGIALARHDRPDVILIDVMLRGLSGFDICRKFRADDSLRNIPIILVTGMDEASVAATGNEVGADGILRKPVDPTSLVAAIQRVRGEPDGAVQT